MAKLNLKVLILALSIPACTRSVPATPETKQEAQACLDRATEILFMKKEGFITVSCP